MLHIEFPFTDYNGHPRKADLHFNLTDLEVVDFSGRDAKKMQDNLQTMIDTENLRGIITFIRELVEASYGVKSEDGIHFEKTPEITRRFTQSAYYSDFIVSLFENDGEKGIKFINAVLPESLIKRAQAAIDEQRADAEKVEKSKEYAPSAREQAETRRSEIPVQSEEQPLRRARSVEGAPEGWSTTD